MRSLSPFVAVVLSSSLMALPVLAAGDKAPAAADAKPADAAGAKDAKDPKDATPTPAAGEKPPAAVDKLGEDSPTTTNSTNTTVSADGPTSSSDPKEVEGKTYYFVGARYRHTFLPKWILNLFVDGGPSVVSIPSAGIEAGFRKDGFDIIGAISYADYSMKEFPFKGKSEADTAYEAVKSNLKLINITADFLWGTDFSPKFAFQYGVTAGLGIVLGDLHRNQLKPASGSAPGDPNSYVHCNGPKDGGSGGYCDDSNDHYGEYSDSSWFNGGKKPNLYPVFGPMIAFRYKPAKQFVARLDGGFNLFTGFFFGIGLNYGI